MPAHDNPARSRPSPVAPQALDKQPGLTTDSDATKVAYMELDQIPPLGGVADELAAVPALRALADRMEDAAVERALFEGWSWTQVAEALAVTRQAVHKKHQPRLAESGIPLRRRNG